MLTRKELKELAHDVLTETLHGSVPMNTVAELAAGVLSLDKKAEAAEAELEEVREWRERQFSNTNLPLLDAILNRAEPEKREAPDG